MFFLIYACLAYGLTNLLVYGSGPFNILGRFRELMKKYVPVIGEMLDCMMCTSTNIGFILSLIDICIPLSFTPFNTLFNNNDYWLLIILFDGFITSGIVWLIHTLQEFFERYERN